MALYVDALSESVKTAPMRHLISMLEGETRRELTASSKA